MELLPDYMRDELESALLSPHQEERDPQIACKQFENNNPAYHWYICLHVQVYRILLGKMCGP